MKKSSQNRYIKVLEIISKLNKTHRQGLNCYFNCGELGIVHVYWHRQWEWEWIELSDEFLVEAKDEEILNANCTQP